MKIFAARELHPGEQRVALNPASTDKLVKLGVDVSIESGIGQTLHHPDADYTAKGATVAVDRAAGLAAADLVLRLRPPAVEEAAASRPGSMHIGYLEPFANRDVIEAFASSSSLPSVISSLQLRSTSPVCGS